MLVNYHNQYGKDPLVRFITSRVLQEGDKMSYGYELILDLHECDTEKFARDSIDEYFKILCELIDMEKCERYFWDDLDTPEEERQTEPHTIGTSAVQFILTSNITIHTLDLLRKVFVNIFSCKEFDHEVAKEFTESWFDGEIVSEHFIDRI